MSEGLEATLRWLDERNVRYEVVEHAKAFAATDEARAAGADPHDAAKALAVHDHDGYRLAVIPAGRRLDLARLREVLGATSHLRLATEEEMGRDFPDFELGALPAFGPLLPAPEVVDVRLLYHDRVLCPSGDHRHSLWIDPRDLVRVAEPQVADVCERRPAAHDEDFAELPRL